MATRNKIRIPIRWISIIAEFIKNNNSGDHIELTNSAGNFLHICSEYPGTITLEINKGND